MQLHCRNLFCRSKDCFSSNSQSEEACCLSHQQHHDESTGHVRYYPASEDVFFGAWRTFPHRHSSDAQRKLPDQSSDPWLIVA